MSIRFTFAVIACSLCVFAEKKPVTLDTVATAGRGGNLGGSPIWAPDGKRFAYFAEGKVMLYNVPAKSQQELLSLKPLEDAAVKIPEPERMEWTNRRVRANSLQWLPSDKQILLSVRGDLFLFNLDTQKWDQLTATPVAEADPKLSPDATRVAFRRDHDLYVLDIASKK